MSMLKKRTNISHFIVYAFLAVVLLGGTSIAVTQSQNDQNLLSNAATVNCTVTASQLTTSSAEQQLLNDINTYRAQNGLTKLTMDPALKQAAAWQTNDMLTHNSLSHTDSLGRSIQTRLTDCGYDVTNSYAESISDLSANPDTVFNGWKSDPSHNELLLLARFNIIGVAMQTNTSGVAYWTVDFGVNPSISVTYPSPSSITPTLFCLGSGSCVPTATPVPVDTQTPTQSITSEAPTSGTTISGTPSANPSQTPCSNSGGTALSVQSTGNVHTLSRSHHIRNGYISQFILLLLQTLIDLIKLLLGGQVPGINPTPCVTPIPTQSVTPTSIPSLQPTVISPTGN